MPLAPLCPGAGYLNASAAKSWWSPVQTGLCKLWCSRMPKSTVPLSVLAWVPWEPARPGAPVLVALAAGGPVGGFQPMLGWASMGLAAVSCLFPPPLASLRQPLFLPPFLPSLLPSLCLLLPVHGPTPQAALAESSWGQPTSGREWPLPALGTATLAAVPEGDHRGHTSLGCICPGYR